MNIMERAIKIAIAGSGYGRKVALPVYAGLEEFEPVAVWSRRPERARELAEEAGVGLGTADFEELLHPAMATSAAAIAATVTNLFFLLTTCFNFLPLSLLTATA